MSLRDEIISKMANLEQYYRISQQEAEAELRRALRTGLPRDSMPFFSIGDYEKAQKGITVPIEQPRAIPLNFAEPTDNRSINQYMQNEAPPSPDLTISQYLQGVGDPIPLYTITYGPIPPI
jgi:hypothetical protein